MINQESYPISGTAENPTEVELGSTIEYRITIDHTPTSGAMHAYRPVSHTEIPEGLSFNANDLRGVLGTGEEVLLSEIAGVNITIDGNRIEWEVTDLYRWTPFTLIVPATVDDDLTEETLFRNTAYLTHFHTRSTGNIRHFNDGYRISEPTYHIFRPDIQVAEDPTITKTANQTTAVIGDTIEYTLTINNPNDFGIDNFIVIDELPNYLTFIPNPIEVTDPNAEFTFVDGVIVVRFNTLEPGYTTITFRATVTGGSGDSITNTARIYNMDPEDRQPIPPEIDDDYHTIDVTLAPPTFNKVSDQGDTAFAGDVIAYVVTITNPNSINLYDFFIIDVFDSTLASLERGSIHVNGVPAEYRFIQAGNSGIIHIPGLTLPANNVAVVVTYNLISIENITEEMSIVNEIELYAPLTAAASANFADIELDMLELDDEYEEVLDELRGDGILLAQDSEYVTIVVEDEQTPEQGEEIDVPEPEEIDDPDDGEELVDPEPEEVVNEPEPQQTPLMRSVLSFLSSLRSRR